MDPDSSVADLGPDRFLNRELSWLAFNDRVLDLVRNDEVPLLERVKFLAIFTTNLDEFFQVRVAGLKNQVTAGLSSRSADGRTAARQLIEVRDEVRRLSADADGLFMKVLVPGMCQAGIKFPAWDELDTQDHKHLTEEFERRMFPVLTPLAVDPGHPFPYISSLSLSLAVQIRDPLDKGMRFARVKVPPLLARFVPLPDGERFVRVEHVIAAHISELFPGVDVVSADPFRVTRDADLSLGEGETDDLLSAMEVELARRRFGPAVRLEVPTGLPSEVRELLQRELEVDDDDVYDQMAPIDLGGLFAVYDLDRPELKYEDWAPVTEPRLAADDDTDLFAVIRQGDVLLHHPYTSFRTSVNEFVHQAAIDPAVQAIKLTLYRTSGESSIVSSLVRAAEAGKQVAALIELKARFDEQANIDWAKRLEEAGVHVVYGLPGLKTHAKTVLVVREEGRDLRTYCHIGTGNYNARTARIYEDLGLLTADPQIGAELGQLFNYLTGFSRPQEMKRLLVAPRFLRDEILALIRGEAQLGPGEGRILMKMNSLTDPEIIDELYAASQAGVEIDLYIRGICCLRPAVPELSENIRVISILGRYLEHSRIYVFANGAGPGEPAIYFGSADLMPRNLDRRVEALAPVLDPGLQARVFQILDINARDNQLSWILGPDGTWRRRPRPEAGDEMVDTHRELQRLTQQRARSHQ